VRTSRRWAPAYSTPLNTTAGWSWPRTRMIALERARTMRWPTRSASALRAWRSPRNVMRRPRQSSIAPSQPRHGGARRRAAPTPPPPRRDPQRDYAASPLRSRRQRWRGGRAMGRSNPATLHHRGTPRAARCLPWARPISLTLRPRVDSPRATAILMRSSVTLPGRHVSWEVEPRDGGNATAGSIR